MKNKYRNSQFDTQRYPEDNHYRRNYDRFNEYNSYNQDLNYPNYERQGNVGYNSDSYPNSRQRNYNNPESYRSNLNYNSDPYNNNYRRNDWYNNDSDNWNDHNNAGRYNNYDRQDRGWWDKTRDEVSSWFGDDDAQRRRRMDEIRDENHRGKGPKNYIRSAERIKEDVNDKLSDSWMLDASAIEVEVKGNEVTLNGTVSSKSDKRKAEDIADNVSGVTHVQNNLRVSKTDSDSLKETSTYNTRTRKEVLNHN